jgi:hypothetical protein
VYRICRVDWDEVGTEEKERLIESLQRRTEDPLVREAVPLVFADHNPWVGTYNAVRAMLERHGRAATGEVDRILCEVCRLYFTSGHPVVVRAVWQDFLQYAGENATARQSLGTIDWSRITYERYSRDEQKMKDFFSPVANFSPARLPQVLRRHQELRGSWYLRLGQKVADPYLALALAALALLGPGLGGLDGRRSAFVLACLVCTYVYFALISVATIYLDPGAYLGLNWNRYACLGSVMLFACAGVVVGGWDVVGMARAIRRGLAQESSPVTEGRPSRRRAG